MEMKRQARLATMALVLVLAAGSAAAYAQGTFKIPFKFEAAGKSFPAGEYWVARKGDSEITLRQEATGKEVQIPFIEKLAQPTPPLEEPQLVFHLVGNFEPSYTEYFTVYLLAEVWLPGGDGLLVHVTKGAHQTQVIRGEKSKS
jgi:hypothetical protein